MLGQQADRWASIDEAMVTSGICELTICEIGDS